MLTVCDSCPSTAGLYCFRTKEMLVVVALHLFLAFIIKPAGAALLHKNLRPEKQAVTGKNFLYIIADDLTADIDLFGGSINQVRVYLGAKIMALCRICSQALTALISSFVKSKLIVGLLSSDDTRFCSRYPCPIWCP